MRIGLLRLQVLRPFPAAAIAAALYDSSARLPLLSIVGGLGGKDVSEAEFDAIAGDLEQAAAGVRVSGPRLLYTQPEQERMRALLRIAGKEVEP